MFGATVFAVVAVHIKIGSGKLINLEILHEKLGWALVFILSFFTITGIAAFMVKKIFKWNSRAIRLTRWAHRIVSYVMYGLATWTVFSGMDLHIPYVIKHHP